MLSASQLIEQLDGRLTDDAEALTELQRIIDEQGIDAATEYWLHGQTTSRQSVTDN